ncbi:MAG: AAA family ATPase [Bacteroidota bacterium]|nr:AAA family ATPase [Bacteroidota bacterium]
MRLHKFQLRGKFKTLSNFKLDFANKDGIALIIGNNGSGKSNILEALSSVFAGLYDHKHNPSFKYQISYFLSKGGDNNYLVTVDYDGKGKYTVTDATGEISLTPAILPSQVVCCYSGEDSRTWEDYYQPFYFDYLADWLKGSAVPTSRMVYINKYYWDVALLTLFLSDFSTNPELAVFCREALGVEQIQEVEFVFDNKTRRKWKKSPVTVLVDELNPGKIANVTLTLADLKLRINYLLETATGQVSFLRYLAAAFLPKDDKLINKINIKINGGIPASALSEGEKKQLLLRAVLDVISDDESLILLDEPDSHVHISRKAEFHKMLAPYKTRQSILTTHSPTLTHAFKPEHIIMLTKDEAYHTKTVDAKKRQVIAKLTDGLWSYQQQNLVLNSKKDILFLEGKYDETFISAALSKLQAKYSTYEQLSFEYVPCNGAKAIKEMMQKFPPQEGQTLFAIWDRDGAGWDAIKEVMGETANSWNDNNFGSYKKQGTAWIVPYPKWAGFGNGNFTVEDYFSFEKLTEMLLLGARSFESLPRSKDVIKSHLSDACGEFEVEEFEHFKCLFDLLLKIKNEQGAPSAPPDAPSDPSEATSGAAPAPAGASEAPAGGAAG